MKTLRKSKNKCDNVKQSERVRELLKACWELALAFPFAVSSYRY